MKDKLIGIEILRFLSACSVLLWHYQHFYFDPGTATIAVERSAEPLYRLLRPFYEYGWLGVNFFWAISGFIFFNRYLTKLGAGAVSGGQFFLLRFSRLYPLHLATLVAVALLQYRYLAMEKVFFVYQGNGAYNFLIHLLFASGWATADGNSFNGPVWSVSTEILVYIAFFLLARYCRIGLAATLGLILASALAGVVLIHHQVKGNELNIVFCCFYFFLGGATHLLYDRFRPVLEARRLASVGLGLLVFLAVIGICLTFGQTKYLIATCLAPLSIVVLQLADAWIPERFSRTIVAFGNMTYSSYLLHFPLQLATILALHQLGVAGPELARSPLFLLAYLVVVFALAWQVYERFEAPAQNLIRRRFALRGARAQVAK